MAAGPEELGGRIKLLRQKEQMTLAELSERSGVAISTLSKIESGQSTGSVDTIFKIARGLGVLFDNLFNLATPPILNGRWVATRKTEAEAVATEHYDYAVHAAGLVNKHMLPLVMTIKTRTPPPLKDWSTHPGEEYVLVLEGAVELHTEHYTPMRLEAGDSAYFDSLMKHCYVAQSAETPRLVAVCLPGSADADGRMSLAREKSARDWERGRVKEDRQDQ